MQILLADDHTLFRAGLKALLEMEVAEAKIVGEAANGLEAVSLAEEFKPDIILMDISMPLLSGLEATASIKKLVPQVKIIILSQHLDNIYVKKAISAGASGYVNKEAVFEEIKVAIDAAQKGRIYLTPSVLEPVITGYLQLTPEQEALAALQKLTPREKEVFYQMAGGCNRWEIGKCLEINPKTVDTHKYRILHKLNIEETEIADFAKKIQS